MILSTHPHIQNPAPLALALLTPHCRLLLRRVAMVMLHRNNECLDPQRTQRRGHSNALGIFSLAFKNRTLQSVTSVSFPGVKALGCARVLTHIWDHFTQDSNLSLTGAYNPGLSFKDKCSSLISRASSSALTSEKPPGELLGKQGHIATGNSEAVKPVTQPP